MIEQNTNLNKHKKPLVKFAIILIVFLAITILWIRFNKETFTFLRKQFSTTPDLSIEILKNKVAQQQIAIQKLQNNTQKQNPDPTTLKPIVIEQLVKMASLTLNTTGDVKTALTFLLAARNYAKEFDEPTIIRALEKDVISLQTMPVVDTEKLVLKIDMISQQINALSMTATATPTPNTTNSEKPQRTNLLKNFLASITNALKNIVIIRHQTIEPMLQPEQTALLRLNIQTKLLQTQLAVMQKQNELYQTLLAQTIDLITKYFTTNNVAATSILQELQKLQQTNLQPSQPSLTEALTIIKKFATPNNTPAQTPTIQPEMAQLL